MKKAVFAFALLMSSAAYAQDATSEDVATDSATSAAPAAEAPAPAADATEPAPATPAASDVAEPGSVVPASTVAAVPASSQIVEPSNANPEHDARGIAVISAAATVPPGFNGMSGSATGVGGPLLDASGQPVAEASYPECSSTVTDNCLQSYERGRAS
jgi:hypothetical protein